MKGVRIVRVPSFSSHCSDIFKQQANVLGKSRLCFARWLAHTCAAWQVLIIFNFKLEIFTSSSEYLPTSTLSQRKINWIAIKIDSRLQMLVDVWVSISTLLCPLARSVQIDARTSTSIRDCESINSIFISDLKQFSFSFVTSGTTKHAKIEAIQEVSLWV